MIAGGELNKKQLAELRKSLASMELPPKKRQRLIWRLAKYGVIAAAKRHVRNQEAPDGQKWPGRKTKRKGKMLRNLPKLLHIREMPEIQAVRIYLQGGGYRNGETPAAPVKNRPQRRKQLKSRWITPTRVSQKSVMVQISRIRRCLFKILVCRIRLTRRQEHCKKTRT